MEFGVRKADAPDRSGGGVYLRRFKPGETKVRFLDETDEWIEYWEHFTPDKKSFPCTGDRETCPGCTSDNEDIAKASPKYATYVFLPKMDVVLPFSLPVSLADSFERRSERNEGTVINRDYVVIRVGKGFDTKYDVDQEDKYPVDFDALRKKIPVTIQECLKTAFAEVWGEDWAPGRNGAAKEHVPGDPNPPTEPAGQGASAAESEVELTEGQIRSMDKADLQRLCERAGLSYDADDTKSELVEKLLASFGD